MILENKKDQIFKFLSSRTLLSKGLEFDCVIIDMTNPLSAKDFYVAMTRAMKKIYIISNRSSLISLVRPSFIDFVVDIYRLSIYYIDVRYIDVLHMED